MKSCLEKNDIEIYSTYNEGKSVIAERLIRTINNKIYKYMTPISKNVYIDILDDTVNKYNNTYHITIKMKPVDVKQSTYIDSIKEINDKDPKLKISNIAKISKYKNIFTKEYVPNWSEEFFVIKKVKDTVPWMLLVILKANNFLEGFMKKHCKKQIKKNLQLKK